MLTSFDTQVHVEETTPDCPYCELPLYGHTRNGLHSHCEAAFSKELDEAFPDPKTRCVLPIPADAEPIEFDWLEDLDALAREVWPD